jgi:MFS family permease
MLLYTLGKGLQLSISAITINLYAYSLGFRSDFIGVLTGMSAIGAFVAGLPVGMLADRLGRKPLILFSAALTPLTLVATALSTSGPLLLTASFVNGLLASAYWVSNLPMLTESTTQQQRVGVLAINSFLLLGVGALGSLIGGAVPELAAALTRQAATATVPLRWGVLAAGVVAFIPAIPLVLLREPSRSRAESTDTQRAEPAPDADARDRNLTHWGLVTLFVMLLLPDVIYATGESSVIGLLQLFFRLRFNLQPGPLGIFIALAGLFGGATSLIAPRLVRRWGKLRMATAMQLMSVPVVLILGFVPVLGVAVAAEVGRNVLRGIFEPTYAAFAMESVSARNRGTLSGFYGITWGIGYSVGPAAAGALQTHVGLSAPFALGAGLILLAPLLLLAFFGRHSARAVP